MKKLFIFLIMLLLLPITTFASDIKITNIEVLSKSDTVTVNESTYDGLTGNLNFKVSEIGDSIKYKITIKNDSTEDFNINLKTNSEIDKYFDYAYTGDTKIEPGKEGTITVQADYVKNLEKDDIENPEYTTNLTLGITSDPLKTDDLVNPNTGLDYKVILLFSIILVIIGITFYNKFNNKSIYKTFILLPLLVIPFIVEANDDEILKININSKIEVPTFTFRFAPFRNTTYYSEEEDLNNDYENNIYKIRDEDITTYEIPIKYSSIYGIKNIDGSTTITKEELEYYLGDTMFTEDQTEEIENIKQQLINGEVDNYIIYKETSRAIIYDTYIYLGHIIKFYTIEYDKDIDEIKNYSTSFMLNKDAINYMMESNPEYVTGNPNEGYNIDDVTLTGETLNEYINNLNQELFIVKNNTTTEIMLIDSYKTNGYSISNSYVANYKESGDKYRLWACLYYKGAEEDTYITDTTSLEFLINDENIIYRSKGEYRS